MKSTKIALVGVMVALISVSAFLRIPFPVMPLTMQMFTIMATPMILGPYYSFAAVFIYIALGLIGLPVFSTGGGPAYVLQPSFGFLIGFLISTIPSGFICRIKNNFWVLLAGGFTAFITIHLVGGLGFWLNMNYVQGKALSFTGAFVLAVLPFIPFDFIKLICAALIAVRINKLLRRFI